MRAEDTVRQHVVLEDSERKECAEHKRELHECVMPMPTKTARQCTLQSTSELRSAAASDRMQV
jgi:hypothetical protein